MSTPQQYIRGLYGDTAGRYQPQRQVGEAEFGFGSPLWESEWAEYRRMQNLLMENMAARLGLATALSQAQQPSPLTIPEPLYEMMRATPGQQPLAQFQPPDTVVRPDAVAMANDQLDRQLRQLHERERGRIRRDQWNELVGRARNYVLHPEQFTPEELVEIIEEGRSRVDRAPGMPQTWEEWRTSGGHPLNDAVKRGAGALLGGFLDEVTSKIRNVSGLIERISRPAGRFAPQPGNPFSFLPDAVWKAQHRGIERANQQANQMLEALSKDLPEERLQAFNILTTTGRVAGFTVSVAPISSAIGQMFPRAGLLYNGKRFDAIGRSGVPALANEIAWPGLGYLHIGRITPTVAGGLLRHGGTMAALELGADLPAFAPDDIEEVVNRLQQGDWTAAAAFLDTKAGRIGAGAVLGTLFEWALPAIGRRIRAAFPARSTGLAPYPGPPLPPEFEPQRPNIPEAEWEFVRGGIGRAPIVTPPPARAARPTSGPVVGPTAPSPIVTPPYRPVGAMPGEPATGAPSRGLGEGIRPFVPPYPPSPPLVPAGPEPSPFDYDWSGGALPPGLRPDRYPGEAEPGGWQPLPEPQGGWPAPYVPSEAAWPAHYEDPATGMPILGIKKANQPYVYAPARAFIDLVEKLVETGRLGLDEIVSHNKLDFSGLKFSWLDAAGQPVAEPTAEEGFGLPWGHGKGPEEIRATNPGLAALLEESNQQLTESGLPPFVDHDGVIQGLLAKYDIQPDEAQGIFEALNDPNMSSTDLMDFMQAMDFTVPDAQLFLQHWQAAQQAPGQLPSPISYTPPPLLEDPSDFSTLRWQVQNLYNEWTQGTLTAEDTWADFIRDVISSGQVNSWHPDDIRWAIEDVLGRPLRPEEMAAFPDYMQPHLEGAGTGFTPPYGSSGFPPTPVGPVPNLEWTMQESTVFPPFVTASGNSSPVMEAPPGGPFHALISPVSGFPVPAILTPTGAVVVGPPGVPTVEQFMADLMAQGLSSNLAQLLPWGYLTHDLKFVEGIANPDGTIWPRPGSQVVTPTQIGPHDWPSAYLAGQGYQLPSTWQGYQTPTPTLSSLPEQGVIPSPEMTPEPESGVPPGLAGQDLLRFFYEQGGASISMTEMPPPRPPDQLPPEAAGGGPLPVPLIRAPDPLANYGGTLGVMPTGELGPVTDLPLPFVGGPIQPPQPTQEPSPWEGPERRNLEHRLQELDPLTGFGDTRAYARAIVARDIRAMAYGPQPELGFVFFQLSYSPNFGEATWKNEIVRAASRKLQELVRLMDIPAQLFSSMLTDGEYMFRVMVPPDRRYTLLYEMERWAEQYLSNIQDQFGRVTQLYGGQGLHGSDAQLDLMTWRDADDANLIGSIQSGRESGRAMEPPFDALAASQEASALSHQNMISESPGLPNIALHSGLSTDALVEAALASDPSGVTIIKNIGGDAANLVQYLADIDMQIPVMPDVITNEAGDVATINRSGMGYRAFYEMRTSEILERHYTNPAEMLDDLRERGFQPEVRTIAPAFMAPVQVTRQGQQVMDLLISNGRPITENMLKQYQAYGTFIGAKVLTPEGFELNVVGFSSHGRVYVQAAPYEPGAGVPLLMYHPLQLTTIGSAASNEALPGDYDARELYIDFLDYASTKIEAKFGSQEMGFGESFYSGAVAPELPKWMDDWMTQRGFVEQSMRHALRSLMNEMWIEDLRMLAPDADRIQFQQALADHTVLLREAIQPDANWDDLAEVTVYNTEGEPYQAPRPTLNQIQELANVKGFDYLPDSPPRLQYGTEITLRTLPEAEGVEVYAKMYDVETGNYAGYYDGILRPSGVLQTRFIRAATPEGSFGVRQMRDLGRQLVTHIRDAGHNIDEIYGFRFSGGHFERVMRGQREWMQQLVRAGNVSYEEALRHWQGPGRFEGAMRHVAADDLLRGPTRLGGSLVRKDGEGIPLRMESDAAAMAFLQDYYPGEVPDVTPITDFPMEAIPNVAGMANPGDNSEPVFQTTEDFYNALEMTAERIERYVDDVWRQEPWEAPEGRAVPPGLVPEQATGGAGLPPGPPLGLPPGPPVPPEPSRGSVPSGEVLSPVPLGEQFEGLRKDDPARLAWVLNRQTSAWTRLLVPMRHRFLMLENDLAESGLHIPIWRQYADMVRAVDQSHNEANPFHKEWSDIVSRFRRRYRRDGTVVRIEEIPNWNDKLRAMQEAGYSRGEMEAQAMIRPFFDKLHGHAGLTHYIFDYIPWVRRRQGSSAIDDPWSGGEKILPLELQFFAEYTRGNRIDFRQLDVGVLGAIWIRGWQFKKHVGPIWEEMAKAWGDPLVPRQIRQGDERIPEYLREMVQNWMHIVRMGHDPREEIAIQGIRQVLNARGIPITSDEVADVWNGLMSNTYRSMMGGRPDVIFRDMIQPLLTWARVGPWVEGTEVMSQVYLDIFRSPTKRAEIAERAERMGTVVRGMVQTGYAEVFTQRAATPSGLELFPENMQRRRERIARVGDVVYDLVPRRMRKGIQGTYMDPLYLYTKLGEWNRIVSGEYGYRIANRAVNRYLAGEIDQQGLLAESRARIYPQPIQDHFLNLVRAGRTEDAKAILANEAANLQFRYGSREAPEMARNVVGRAGFMFGTFSQQFLAYTKEGLSNGTRSDRAGFGLRYAAILAAIGAAGLYTGWKFSKWMWHNSLAFAGGPIIGFLGEAQKAWEGVTKQFQGYEPTASERAAMRNMTLEGIVGGFAEAVFPYSGTVRTAQRFGTQVGLPSGEVPYQGERALQLLLTGETTWGPIYEREYMPQSGTIDYSRWRPEWRAISPAEGTGGRLTPQLQAIDSAVAGGGARQ